MKQQHIKKSKQEKSVSFQFKKGGENKIESYESIAGGVADALIYKQKKCSSSKSENLLLYIVNFIREFLQRTQIILLSLLLVFKLFFSGIFLNKVRFCPSNNLQTVKSIIQCSTNKSRLGNTGLHRQFYYLLGILDNQKICVTLYQKQ